MARPDPEALAREIGPAPLPPTDPATGRPNPDDATYRAALSDHQAKVMAAALRIALSSPPETPAPVGGLL